MNKTDIPSPGAVYDAYERVVAAVERGVVAANPAIPGCDDVHVRARIVQRIVQITEVEAARQLVEHIRRSEPVSQEWRIDGLTIRPTGELSIGFRQWLLNTFYFAAVWLDMLVGLVKGCCTRAPLQSSSAAILMEAAGGFEAGDERLAKFCQEGPIEPLAKASAVIVRSATAPRRPVASRLHYSSRPFVYLANTFLTRGDRIALLWHHLSAPWLFLRAILASPLNVLVARDLAWVPAVRWLDRAGLVDAILVTTTAFTTQQLWAQGVVGRRFKLHMLWYSQNVIPKMYPGDTRRPDLPPMRHMRIDVHWVWTEGFGQYLREIGQTGQIRVVGPILWYLPEASEPLARADWKVVVFDVTPLPEGRTAFGASKNYYTPALMKKFIADIVDVCEGIAAAHGRTVLIAIKHKRAAVLTHHDPSYLAFLDGLLQQRPAVRLVDHDVNVFGLMEECDLSVAVPYTSSAFLSAAMKKPAIYYDPFAELVPVVEKNPYVHFAGGVDELRRVVEQCLAGSWRSRGTEAVS